MKIVVDKIPNCSSDCIFSRYFSCERRRCILTDNICVLDSDVPCECHKLTTIEIIEAERAKEKQYDEFMQHVELMRKITKIGE